MISPSWVVDGVALAAARKPSSGVAERKERILAAITLAVHHFQSHTQVHIVVLGLMSHGAVIRQGRIGEEYVQAPAKYT